MIQIRKTLFSALGCAFGLGIISLTVHASEPYEALLEPDLTYRYLPSTVAAGDVWGSNPMVASNYSIAASEPLVVNKAPDNHANHDSTPDQDSHTDYDWSAYKVSLFSPTQGEDKERLWSQTKLVGGLGIGVAGFIALLPEDISNWEKDPGEAIYKKWWENVKEGPVWDEDDWAINYIGHPYFGGVYYQVARKSGYGEWDSFVYSALMSTFYWEYGLEAFAEVPSIQDLVVTPVGGWLYGEWAYNKEKQIIANDSRALGSKRWGSVALFFLDPVDSIAVSINGWVGKEWIKAGNVMITPTPQFYRPVVQDELNDYYGIDLVLVF